MPTGDFFFFPPGVFMPARGIGVVGALVTSVGASAEAVRGGGGRRCVLCPAFGAATGCSGQTPVANSSIVPKRCAGSFDRAREIADVRNSGVSDRLRLTRGTSSKMCL